MKEIKAYIKAIKLHDVTQALHHIDGVDGASVFEVRGFGRSKETSSGWGDGPSEFVKHMKLELVCEDELEDQIVAAIHKAAHTGLRGDGKIYVSDIATSARIEDPPK